MKSTTTPDRDVGSSDSSAPTSSPYAYITSKDMLRAADICAKAAHDPLNRGEIASILLGASRILANTSLRGRAHSDLNSARFNLNPSHHVIRTCL